MAHECSRCEDKTPYTGPWGYRHDCPAPGAGNECRNGRSLSTAGANDDFPEGEGGRAPSGASEEREARVGWGQQCSDSDLEHLGCELETGEGGEPPSHLSVLKLAALALPVSPTSHLRCSNSAPAERRSPNGDIPLKSVHRVSPTRTFGAQARYGRTLHPHRDPPLRITI